jgi:hypothetical protein
MAGALRLVLGALAVALAVYCGTDPFKHSSMADFPGFEVFSVELPHWSELPTAKDRENKLQKAEIRFLNQVQGPESVAFDPLGRGPYTGIADGRVLFWDGSAWKDFAYTSPNRCVSSKFAWNHFFPVDNVFHFFLFALIFLY